MPKNVFRYLLVITFLSTVFAVNVFGRNFYVDPSSGNDNNSGLSPSSAWKTINKINSFAFSAGDTISFKCGERFFGYTLTPGRDSLTFNSYGSGDKPVIDGLGSMNCLNMSYKTGVKFENLKFVHGFPRDIAFNDNEYVTIEDCNIDSCAGTNIYNQNIYTGQGTHLTIRNSTISYAGAVTGGGHGIYIDGTDNTILEYDTLLSNKNDNIRIAYGYSDPYYSDSLIIRYCTIKYAGYENISDDGSRYSKVYYNVFENETASWSENISLFTSGGYAPSSNRYFNNTIIIHDPNDQDNAGFFIYTSASITGMQVFNNIFYSVDSLKGWAIYSQSGSAGTWKIDHNLYYSVKGTPQHLWHWSNSVPASFSKWQAQGFDSSGAYGNPLFTSGTDYTLQNHSPAISLGESNSINRDINNNVVPSPAGTNPDAGAFENTVSYGALIPAAPVLVSPANAAAGVELNSALVWKSVFGAASYLVEVSTDTSFSNLVFNKSGITDTLINLNGLAYNTVYYWRVEAVNASGSSPWSAVWYFKTTTGIDWCNLQSPGSGVIAEGDSIKVFAQVFINGITGGLGPSSKIQAWIGYGASNSNPADWTTWVPAVYSRAAGNYDEYSAYIGGALKHGTYFFASRFNYNNSGYRYGGFSPSGGGFWDGTNNVSGTLLVNYKPIAAPSGLIALNQNQGILLSWKDNSNNESGFVIQRHAGDSTSAAVFSNIDTVSADRVQYIDNTNIDSSFYTYRVFAINQDTASGFSNQAQVFYAVPVEITKINVEAAVNSVAVYWETATELNNKGFEIERALSRPVGTTPRQDWMKIGFVQGKVNSTENTVYKFIDNFGNLSYKGIVEYRIKQIDIDGSYSYSSIISINIDFSVKSYYLSQNYPNPFNPSTTIHYELPYGGIVTLRVYDVLGNVVRTIVNGFQTGGKYDVVFNALGGSQSLSSGIYFYSLSVISPSGNNFFITKKMLMIK